MLFDQPGTIKILCDAPPYSIVRACRALGFCSPEDVRWCQDRTALLKLIRRQGYFGLRFLKSLIFGERIGSCVCGHALPTLERYRFVLSSGAVIRLLLGQCQSCKTIFWREV